MPSITAGELRRKIQGLLGDNSGTFITPENCFDWINDAQRQIAKIAECLTADLAPINSVIGQEWYALNASLVKIVRVTYEGRKLRGTTIDEIDRLDPHRDIPGQTNGYPTHYYIDGFQIGLWPRPAIAVAGALKIRARVLPTVAVANDADIISIPDLFSEDIIKYGTIKGREKDEAPEFITVLLQQWKENVSISKSITDNPENSYASVVDTESGLDYATTWWE